MRIPESVIQEIKEKNPIEEVIAPYVQLKRAGRNLKGLCPFHSEKTPSFTVYPESSSYYCFGCGAGGDSVNFIRQIENLDYIEALKKLADRAGVVIPEGDYDDSYARLKKRILEINREAARFYHAYLFTPGGKWALDYLTGRGLTLQTIRHFGLGVAPDAWEELLKHLKAKGFRLTEMEQANVIVKGNRGGYYDRFRKRTMFPIFDLRGNVIGFSGRRAPDEERGGKYVNTSDTAVYKKSKELFGLNFAKNFCSERILVVEGNMDVISLHQAGFENTIGTLGTAFTDEHARLLARYTKEVVLSFDSDAAGQKAVARAMEVLGKTGLSVRVMAVDDGKDPDEYIKKNGAEKFRAILDGAVNEVEYRLHAAAAGLNLQTDDGRSKYLNRAAEELSQLQDQIAADLYIGRLAQKFSVSKEVLAAKVEQLRKKKHFSGRRAKLREIVTPRLQPNAVNPEKQRLARAVSAEEEILALLIAHPDYLTRQQDLSPLFVSALNRRVLQSLTVCAQQGAAFDIGFIAADYTPEEIGYITSLTAKRSAFNNPAESFKQSVQTLREENEKQQLSQSGSLSQEQWADEITKMIRSKKEHNGNE